MDILLPPGWLMTGNGRVPGELITVCFAASAYYMGEVHFEKIHAVTLCILLCVLCLML